ncbi:MAG: DNA topoisomerase VI subunit B [Phycisphaerae bacterium]|nr:MAG: DNA topoisomerase VI subunit B [Planctomycetota bacterium]GJQ25865.1 MAG: DNA topoisomerase VI subunit B [Phycisphaerae bacterium]
MAGSATLNRPRPKAKDQLQLPFGQDESAATPAESPMPATSGTKSKDHHAKSDKPSKAVRAREESGTDKRRGAKSGFATAESMSKSQREISVSEFFAKNRHLLGFDNKRKALLTTVKEAVDNSLDACEEAGILPDIHVRISQTDAERYAVTVRDNGPGIVKQQIPNVFGKLLYGSKFHRLKMSRGQQGIGISAAGMYGLLTTGKSVRITSRTGKRADAHYYELQINTKTNDPQIVKEKTINVDWDHGTEVTIELVATYQKGRASVDEYLELTAIANPHARFEFVDPEGAVIELPRGTDVAPAPAVEIKPHPYGIELGVLIKMLKDTRAKTMSQFLSHEFSRVSVGTASTICEKAGVSARSNPHRIGTHEAETLYKAMQETPIRAPATNCLSPIGEKQVLAGLLKGVRAEFFTATTRPPAVYRGNPFQIEVGLAYGGELGPDPSAEEEQAKQTNEAVVRRGKVVTESKAPSTAKLLRFANRVPLLFQPGGCCITKAVTETDWRRYGLSQPGGALPQGPLAIFVHMASVWVPFTSEGKEAVADYDEIRKEIKLAVQDCGRKLQAYLNRRKKQKYESDRRSIFQRYIGELVNSVAAIKRINKQELTDQLLAIAKKVTARADEEVELIGGERTNPARGGKTPGKAGKKSGRGGKATESDAVSSEYGENTIVVDRAAQAPGPLFK